MLRTDHRAPGESGAAVIEYVGLLAFVAAIFATLATTNVAEQVGDSAQTAICRIISLDGADCGADASSPQADGAEPADSEGSGQDTTDAGNDEEDPYEGIQDPRSPNPLADYCGMDAIDDGVIQEMLDDYCGFRAAGHDPNSAYTELMKDWEQLDYFGDYHERDSDQIITGWWMASNSGWWNGGDEDHWSDDGVAAMLLANDKADNPAPGTDGWNEQLERYEENGWPTSDRGEDGATVLGLMQDDYESALQGVWREDQMDDLFDVLLAAGLEAGTLCCGR